MSITFNKVSGGKFAFIEDQEVKNLIEEAGRKKIVFVEGYTDTRVFNILYDDFSDVISFIPVGTHHKVKEYLTNIIEKQIKGFTGVVDRDFMSQEARTKMLEEYQNLIYIHGRYTLENYLIESESLLELIKDYHISVEIELEDVQQLIQEIFEKLLVVMAGNMVLLEYSAKKLQTSVPLNEDKVLKNVISRIEEKEDDHITERVIREKYNIYLEQIKQKTNIDDLHEVVSGKYFLHNFREEIKKQYSIKLQINKATPFYLARIIKNVNGIKGDLLLLFGFLKNLVGEEIPAPSTAVN